jgi:hypothetical protein
MYWTAGAQHGAGAQQVVTQQAEPRR